MRAHEDLLYPDHETLRPWQPDNIRGILKVWRDGSLIGTGTAIGALLASSMGMGKCAISIVAANTAGLERVLVIAPKAAIPDWTRDIRRFHTRAPLIRHLSARKRWIDIPVGWVLLNYGNVERWPELKEKEWDLLILDEAQALKEPSAKRTKFIFGGEWKGKRVEPIPCRKAIVVSGTPLKNRPEEIFNTLHFLDAHHWTDRRVFIRQHYPKGHQVTNKGRVVQNVKPRNLVRLGEELVETVLVRSNKDKAGLPPKHFEQILSPCHKIPIPTGVWFDHKATEMFFLGLELKETRNIAIKTGRHAMWERVRILEDEMHEIETAIRYTAGEIKAPSVLAYLLSLTEKTLVIVQHLHILDQLEGELKKAGRRVVVHSGRQSSPTEAVRAFQTDPDVQFFIGQAMASSLSLTLTAAHHVVFAEMPLTRADFEQAVDRLHRIGQEHDVWVTVFTVDLFESGDPSLLQYMHERKDIADQILDRRTEPGTEMLMGNPPGDFPWSAPPVDLSGGHWNWNARWVWHNNGLVPPEDPDYEAKLEAWHNALVGTLFGDLGSGFMSDLFGFGDLGSEFRPELTPRQKAKRVIQFLIRKTVKRGCTPGEAATARRKAKELMARYKITKDEILRVVV